MNNSKKIYIAGAGGMLGEAFYQVFGDDYKLKCTDIDVNDEWISYLDFRNYDAYAQDVLDFQPDYLFHLGAFTDLEFCEQHPDETYATNTLSVENAVLIAQIRNTELVMNYGSIPSYSLWDEYSIVKEFEKNKFYPDEVEWLMNYRHIVIPYSEFNNYDSDSYDSYDDSYEESCYDSY